MLLDFNVINQTFGPTIRGYYSIIDIKGIEEYVGEPNTELFYFSKEKRSKIDSIHTIKSWEEFDKIYLNETSFSYS